MRYRCVAPISVYVMYVLLTKLLYNKHVIKMLMKVHLACLATVWFRIILRVYKPISTYYTVIANVRTASCCNYFADESVIRDIYII